MVVQMILAFLREFGSANILWLILVFVIPRYFFSGVGFLCRCCRTQKKFKPKSAYDRATDWQNIWIFTGVLLAVLVGFRYQYPLQRNYFEVLNINHNTRPAGVKWKCNKIEEKTLEQIRACETLEKRTRRRFYELYGPGYEMCETCSDDGDYFLSSQSGFMLKWMFVALALIVPIGTQKKLECLRIRLSSLVVVFAILTLGIYFSDDPITMDYPFGDSRGILLSFQINQLLVDVFWFLYGSWCIVVYFWGGDHRSNRDIMLNIQRCENIYRLLLNEVMVTHMIPYEDFYSRKKKADDIKGKHKFHQFMYQKIERVQAYFAATLKTFDLKKDLRPLNPNDPTAFENLFPEYSDPDGEQKAEQSKSVSFCNYREYSIDRWTRRWSLH